MYDLAPGTILQRMYVSRRLKKKFQHGMTFIEVGAGKGYWSELFLQHGFTGCGVDLNAKACEFNQKLNNSFITSNKYSIHNQSFLTLTNNEKVDIIFSCMVIEHLDEMELQQYFAQCQKLLKPSGIIMLIVPAAQKYWGIEDEIAGHMKRYEFSDFTELANKKNLHIQHLKGLTYPLSNLLYKLSNYLVNRAEQSKQQLSMQDRTVQSGYRQVMFKTSYPDWVRFIVNPWTLYPWYLLQLWFSKSPNCMVIYCEMRC